MSVIFFDLQRFAGVNKENLSSNVTFSGTNDADTLNNRGNNVTIEAQGGNDSIVNLAMNPSITSHSYGKKVSINAGDGSDTISNNGMYCTIDGGAGDDTISNTISNAYLGKNASLFGENGNDYLTTYNSDGVLLDGGADNDTIAVWGNSANISVNGSEGGNDLLNGDSGNDTLIGGDGKDVIYYFGDNDLLKITRTFSASYSKSKAEVYFKVGNTSKAITLHDFTATNFNVNGTVYHISGTKLVKK